MVPLATNLKRRRVRNRKFAQSGAEDDQQFVDIFELGLIKKNAFPTPTAGWWMEQNSNYTALKPLKKVKGITGRKVHGNTETISAIENQYHPQTESMEGASFFLLLSYEGDSALLNCGPSAITSKKPIKRTEYVWRLMFQQGHRRFDHRIKQMKLTLGYSPGPNDIYFWCSRIKKIDTYGIELTFCTPMWKRWIIMHAKKQPILPNWVTMFTLMWAKPTSCLLQDRRRSAVAAIVISKDPIPKIKDRILSDQSRTMVVVVVNFIIHGISEAATKKKWCFLEIEDAFCSAIRSISAWSFTRTVLFYEKRIAEDRRSGWIVGKVTSAADTAGRHLHVVRLIPNCN